MRPSRCLPVALCLALGLAPVSRADDKAKAIVDKGIEAAGGEANLSKYKGRTFKIKGNFYGMGDGIPYTGEVAVQLPSQSKQSVEADVGGQKFMMVTVVDGDKAWRKTNGMLEELEKDAATEEKENLHASWVATLLPLKDAGFKLTSLGDSKVGDHEATGIKVAHEGHRDVKLYFDKNTGLLIKLEHRIKDMMSGEEANQETIFSDFKEADGIKAPAKSLINRNGTKYIESENTDIKHHEKLDAGTFAKPS
jgi:hypothetical protein